MTRNLKAFDTNGDGTITREEVQASLSNLAGAAGGGANAGGAPAAQAVGINR